MTLLHMDGFDSYATSSDLLLRYVTYGPTGGARLYPTGGRFGGGYWASSDNTPDASCLSKAVSSPAGSTLYVGRWFLLANVPTARGLVWLGSPSSYISSTLLGVSSTGTLQAMNGLATAVASGTAAVADGTWHWVEFSLNYNSSGATIQCYVDGLLDFTYTGALGGTGGGALTQINFSGSTDDLVIYDDQGTTFNASSFPLGPRRITQLDPSGAGDSTGFTPSNGAANYTCVSGLYSATTSVSATGTTDTDLYTIPALPYQPTVINAVQLTVLAQNPGTGTRTLQPLIKTAGVIAQGTVDTLPNGTTHIYAELFMKDPNGNPWTYNTVSACQIGYVD